jgi:hypothetical protein
MSWVAVAGLAVLGATTAATTGAVIVYVLKKRDKEKQQP